MIFGASMIGVDSCDSLAEILSELEARRHELAAESSQSEQLSNLWMFCRLDASYSKLWDVSERLLSSMGGEMGVEFPGELTPGEIKGSYSEIVNKILDHLRARQLAFSEHRAWILENVSDKIPEPSEEDLARLSRGELP